MHPFVSLVPLLYTVPTLLRAFPLLPYGTTHPPIALSYSSLTLLLLLPSLLSLFYIPPLVSIPPLITACVTTLLSLRYAHLSPLPHYHPAFHRLDVTLLYTIPILHYVFYAPIPLRFTALALTLLAMYSFVRASVARYRCSPPSALRTFLRMLLPSMQQPLPPDRPVPPTPRNASAFTLLSFHWMTHTVSQGRLRSLEDDDILPLADRFGTSRTGHTTFQPLWREELATAHPKLFRALFRAFGTRLLLGGLLKAVNDICIFVSPMLLRKVRFWDISLIAWWMERETVEQRG